MHDTKQIFLCISVMYCPFYMELVIKHILLLRKNHKLTTPPPLIWAYQRVIVFTTSIKEKIKPTNNNKFPVCIVGSFVWSTKKIE